MLPLDTVPVMTLGPDSTLEDIQAVADTVADYIGLTVGNTKALTTSPIGSNNDPWFPTVKGINKARGYANYRRGDISIPRWVLQKNWAQIVQYIAHEVIHFERSTISHCANFKRIEKEVCRELFGLDIAHSRAYVKRITDIETGEDYLNKKEKIKETWGDSKRFDIGEVVRHKNQNVKLTVKRRNKKTVTVQLEAAGPRGETFTVAPKYLEKIES